MTVLEYLSSQLDREMTQFDTQRIFSEEIEFWNLCLEARSLLIDEKLTKQKDKDATNIG